jgi:hypothetical protein
MKDIQNDPLNFIDVKLPVGCYLCMVAVRSLWLRVSNILETCLSCRKYHMLFSGIPLNFLLDQLAVTSAQNLG